MTTTHPLFRIASLVPSLTELVVELGLRECLVARTGFCIHPAGALADVPKVGGTKDIILDRLATLAPTHVLVNIDENQLETVQAMRAWANPPVVVITHPLTPHDNLPLIAQMVEHFGAHPGVRARAAALTDALASELALTQAAPRTPRRVLYLIWREPWMTVARDTYLSAMLAQIGWQTWPAIEGGHSGAARYPVLLGDEPWLAQIDQVLLSSEPYRFGEAHLPMAQALCPAARVRLVDGELMSWYGPRAIAGLRALRALAADDGR